MPQVAVMAHLHVLRGWAHLEENLPWDNPSAGDSWEMAWRHLDQLWTFTAELMGGPLPEVWEQLLSDLGPQACQVLHTIHLAESATFGGTTVVAGLLTMYPPEFRNLFEWAIDNFDSATDSGPLFVRHELVEFKFRPGGEKLVPSRRRTGLGNLHNTAIGAHLFVRLKAARHRSRLRSSLPDS